MAATHEGAATRATIGAGGISIAGPLSVTHLGALTAQLEGLLRQTTADRVAIDLEQVTALDTAGVVFLEDLPAWAARSGRQVEIGPLPPRFGRFQRFVAQRQRRRPAVAAPPAGALERLGEWVLQSWRRTGDLLFLASDLTWSALRALGRGPTGIRAGALVEQASALGSSALPIVAVILFLIGAVSSLQAAAQLRKFGADIFVAELLAIGITRELGPLMTAIIVAGRSGSAIAAEVATMKYSEELDALQTMSLDPLRFVAVPKLWAMVLCVPLLTIMADLIGILGGLTVAVTLMGLAPEAFLDQLLGALFVRDVASGLIKSLSFAWAVTIVGVYEGLAFRGGATGVGRATTAAVVMSIAAIIVLDSFWGLVFYLG